MIYEAGIVFDGAQYAEAAAIFEEALHIAEGLGDEVERSAEHHCGRSTSAEYVAPTCSTDCQERYEPTAADRSLHSLWLNRTGTVRRIDHCRSRPHP